MRKNAYNKSTIVASALFYKNTGTCYIQTALLQGDGTMEEQYETKVARELFSLYAAQLNAKFYDDESAQSAHQECLKIYREILELGFIILSQTNQSIKKTSLPHEMMQTVITFTYDLALIKHEIPLRQPLAVISVASEVFGPPFALSDHGTTGKSITPQDEAWLRSILESL